MTAKNIPPRLSQDQGLSLVATLAHVLRLPAHDECRSNVATAERRPRRKSEIASDLSTFYFSPSHSDFRNPRFSVQLSTLNFCSRPPRPLVRRSPSCLRRRVRSFLAKQLPGTPAGKAPARPDPRPPRKT